MKVALGTAQFGLRYGVANVDGQVSAAEAALILAEARQAGIDTLDTAVTYGNSEERLGALGIDHWKVITKLPAIPEAVTDAGVWVVQQVHGSLERLRVQQLDGLLLHRPADILGSHRIGYTRGLEQVKALGLAQSIGYSIYSPDELAALCRVLPPDLVQAPYNLLDRRLEASGWLSKLADRGVRIHTRSAFLQGLLLMPNNARPGRFERWQGLWRAWNRACAESGLGPLELALGFVLSQPAIECVVVGVDSITQMREILAAARGARPAEFPQIESHDLDLIEPSRWRNE